MTDRKPALKPMRFAGGGPSPLAILASDLPPAILNATKEELAALAVFAEAMPELLEPKVMNAANAASYVRQVLRETMNAALAAAKEAAP